MQERIKSNAEGAYDTIGQNIARACGRLKCPNPYLALESIRGPKEVWWLNAFASRADSARVDRAWRSDVIVPVVNESDAEQWATMGGSSSRIFAVQPRWTLPADAWVAADPGFWRDSPAVQSQRRGSRQ